MRRSPHSFLAYLRFKALEKNSRLKNQLNQPNRPFLFLSLGPLSVVVHYCINRMVNWMHSIMKKSRRRQSQSPNSSEKSPSRESKPFFGGGSNKHKRRAVRKDSSTSITEGESLCSQGSVDRSETAAWRVENIRNAPPTGDDWWRDISCETKLSRSYSSDSEDDEVKEEGYETIVLKSPSGHRQFHNCGLEAWKIAREEWKKRTVDTLPPRPTPAEYNQLVKGLTKSSSLRTYELPRRMALSDLINVYNDIWEG